MSDADFEARLMRALRTPIHGSVHSRRMATESIMARVRDASRTSPPRRRPAFPGTARHAIVGLAMAAGIGSISTLSALTPQRGAEAMGTVTSAVIGDTVSDALRDTLRLVRLMFDAPAATRVAMVGDFNGWKSDVTPLHRGADGRWTVTVALRDGSHRYAIVADETRWQAESTNVRGRTWSYLRVAPTAN